MDKEELKQLLKDNLTLHASKRGEGSVKFELRFDGETLGESFFLGAYLGESDHQHGSDHYYGVDLEVT